MWTIVTVEAVVAVAAIDPVGAIVAADRVAIRAAIDPVVPIVAVDRVAAADRPAVGFATDGVVTVATTNGITTAQAEDDVVSRRPHDSVPAFGTYTPSNLTIHSTTPSWWQSIAGLLGLDSRC